MMIFFMIKNIFQFVLKKSQSGQASLVLNLKLTSNNNLQNNKNISYGQINKSKDKLVQNKFNQMALLL